MIQIFFIEGTLEGIPPKILKLNAESKDNPNVVFIIEDIETYYVDKEGRLHLNKKYLDHLVPELDSLILGSKDSVKKAFTKFLKNLSKG